MKEDNRSLFDKGWTRIETTVKTVKLQSVVTESMQAAYDEYNTLCEMGFCPDALPTKIGGHYDNKTAVLQLNLF